MGLNIGLSWFKKSLDELYAIREKEGKNFSKEKLDELNRIIAEKENEKK